MFLSKQVKRNVIITNKNGKYELTDKLSDDVRIKKISELHRIRVYYLQEITKNQILNFSPRAEFYMKS